MGSFFVPVLSIFILFTLPIPFLIYTYKHELSHSVIMFVITMTISSIFLLYISLPLTLLMGLGGSAIGYGLKQKRKSYETLALGTLGYSVGIVLVYVLSQFFFQVNWSQEIQNAIDESLQTFTSFYDQVGELSEEDLELYREQMYLMIYKIPSMIVIAGLAFAWITQWLGHKIINKMEGDKLKFPPFREFSLPVSLIWYYFAGVILLLIFPSPEDSMFLVADNLTTLAGVLLALQGLSFIFFLVHVKKWPKVVPMIVVILFIIQPILLLYPLRILGIIDLGLQLRGRLTKKK
ncbi:YybS family protein [Piscibacillus salipiscarius]|uniref:YybS family protein n=1 Tax=Piscibacillus salipiscarius TaxID=299480 RepID=UPI002436A039|nr:YybS family protein [Piscibacillus salipiscarius]